MRTFVLRARAAPTDSQKLLASVGQEAHPEILAGPCRDAFGEGKTPQQCVRAVVKAFAEFAALDKR